MPAPSPAAIAALKSALGDGGWTDDPAEIARQLRRGGYRLSQVAQFLDSLREAGGADALSAFLESWQDRLTTRSRNLLAGAAQLDAYLTMLDQTSPGCRSANG